MLYPGVLLPVAALAATFATGVSAHGDPSQSRNRLPGDTSFETTAGDLLTQQIIGAAEAEITDSEAAFGEQSLRLRFAPGERTRGEPVAFKAGRQTFSFYAKAEVPTKVQVRFVKTDWRHTVPSAPMEVGTEWKRLSVTRDFKDGFYHINFGIEGEGALWVDALQLEAGDQASEYMEAQPVNLGIEIASKANRVFFKGEPVNLVVGLNRSGAAMEDGAVSVEVRDGGGELMTSERFSAPAADGASLHRRKLTLAPRKLGLYKVKASYRSEAGSLEQWATFAVVNPPVPLAPGVRPFSAINPPVSEGVRRIGSHWVGMAVQWSIIETKRGEFHWEAYDQFFQGLLPEEQVILSIGRNPVWSWDPKELAHAKELGIQPGPWGLLIDRERMDDWRRFIRELVGRYGSRVAIWEIGAEDDLHWGQHPYYSRLDHLGLAPKSQVYERQAETIIAAAEEIRAQLPDATIGAIRPSGVDSVEVTPMYRYSSAVLEKAGKAINVFPIDPYGSSRYLTPGQTGIKEPEAYLPESYQAAREMLDRVSPEAALYVSEYGYSVGSGEQPEGKIAQTVAQYLARTFLLTRATPGMLMSRWYTGFNGGVPTVFHYNMWYGRNPSLAVPAFSTVAALVENVQETTRIDLDERVWAVAFRKEDHARGAIWQPKGESVYRFKGGESLTFSDLMGNPLEPKRSGREWELVVGQSPVYLSASGGNAFEQVAGFLKSGNSTAAPVEISLATPRVDQAIVHLRNQAPQPIEATVMAGPPNGAGAFRRKITIGKGATGEVAIPLQKDAKSLSLRCEFGGRYEALSAQFALDFHPCERVADEFQINGDLSKWKHGPVAVLDHEGHLRPEDWNPWQGKEDLSVEVYLGWNSHYLYLAAKVRDDLHSNAPSQEEIGKGDCLEVGIDPLREPGRGGRLAPECFDFHISRDERANALFRQWTGPTPDLLQKGDYIVVRDEDDKTTVYELRIAWDRAGIAPEKGGVFGLNMAVFDNDSGRKSRAWMQWGLGLTQGKDSSLFPRVYLKDQ